MVLRPVLLPRPPKDLEFARPGSHASFDDWFLVISLPPRLNPELWMRAVAADQALSPGTRLSLLASAAPIIPFLPFSGQEEIGV